MKIYIRKSHLGEEKLFLTTEGAAIEVLEILREWESVIGGGTIIIRMEP